MVLSSVPWLEYLEQLKAVIAQVGLTASQLPWLEYLDQLCALAQQAGCAKVLATGAGAYAAYRVFHALYLSPLRNIPGPFLARLTPKRAEIYGFKGDQAHKALEDYERYGDIYVFKPNAISISNPKDARTVFGSHAFPKPDSYKAHDVFGTQTTLSARDPKFASMRRRQIGPYFSRSYLVKMEDAIIEHGFMAIKGKWDGLLGQAKDGQIEINYHRTFLYTTFDIIGNLAFGRDFGALRNDDATVTRWFGATLAIVGLQGMFPLSKFLPFSLLLSPLKKVQQEFIDYGARCIAARKDLLADLEKKGELEKKPADLLQGFLESSDPESKIRMSPTEVHAESLLMLIAGSETTANTLMWTMHLLMLYPACFKRAVDEVRSAFDKDHVITYDEARAQLPYFEACIYESMRLCPVAGSQFARAAPKNGVTLSGHFIPGGTVIHVNLIGANLNKNHWKNPHLYDPTRFLDNEEAKRSIFTFITGVRTCPGKQLAWIEIFTTLANMLKDYDLRLPEDYTLCGPNVLDKGGIPRLMDSKLYVTRTAANPERDCRLVVSKRKA
ncbi:hypothetical protein GGI12_005160 [Dipsacomyces acuminosporus]|nr:hypothetical protein GGI12_005160 [Dipsacomyces acuminosporus]